MDSTLAHESFARRLGLGHALIQAPMAGVQGHALAAAVMNAGALGSLPAALLALAQSKDGRPR
jgi:nitronate monooxygenase